MKEFKDKKRPTQRKNNRIPEGLNNAKERRVKKWMKAG